MRRQTQTGVLHGYRSMQNGPVDWWHTSLAIFSKYAVSDADEEYPTLQKELVLSPYSRRIPHEASLDQGLEEGSSAAECVANGIWDIRAIGQV
jgi:hypothetical protein